VRTSKKEGREQDERRRNDERRRDNEGMRHCVPGDYKHVVSSIVLPSRVLSTSAPVRVRMSKKEGRERGERRRNDERSRYNEGMRHCVPGDCKSIVLPSRVLSTSVSSIVSSIALFGVNGERGGEEVGEGVGGGEGGRTEGRGRNK
jgi:hypothetical protein